MNARVAALGYLILSACGGGTPKNMIPGDRGPALTVEVLNASGRAGEARVGTRLLRRAGIDVVYFGNATDDVSGLDSTRIIVRRGAAKVGERIVLAANEHILERHAPPELFQRRGQLWQRVLLLDRHELPTQGGRRGM